MKLLTVVTLEKAMKFSQLLKDLPAQLGHGDLARFLSQLSIRKPIKTHKLFQSSLEELIRTRSILIFVVQIVFEWQQDGI